MGPAVPVPSDDLPVEGSPTASPDPDLSAANESLGSLATYVDPLVTATPTLRAYEAFSADSKLYALAVVDEEGRPVGLINRFKFFEALSRPFGRDLLKHRSVTAVMDSTPLTVDERMPLDQLSEILADDGTKYIFDGFIVTRQGKYIGLGTGYSLMRRLTERRQAVLFHLAHHDPLTELPNRQLFADRLTQAIANAQRSGRQVAVIFIDVDRFKAVNDSMGHGVGDLLLIAIAARLRSVTRAQDTVARLSGDEFAIVLADLNAAPNAELVARKLLHVLREPHVLEHHEVNVSCSLGVAIFPDDAQHQPGLMRAADDAAFHAKQFRNTSQRYAPEMQRTQPDAPLAFSSVRRAIDARELHVVYQPQLRAGDRTLVGIEALVRWSDREGGLRATTDLIRLAEDAGMIGAVTDFVLGVAIPQVLEWQRNGLAPDVRLAINISGVEVLEGGLVPTLQRHLAETGFPASLLELEITESTAMRSGASTLAVLNEIRRLGITLAVDDFGTGYSALSRLERLPVDVLKIDQSFVHGIEGDEGAGALAQAIIAMGHALGLAVTAEGIETPRQLAFLERSGCDRLQGYLLSRPLTAAEFVEFRTQNSV